MIGLADWGTQEPRYFFNLCLGRPQFDGKQGFLPSSSDSVLRLICQKNEIGLFFERRSDAHNTKTHCRVKMTLFVCRSPQHFGKVYRSLFALKWRKTRLGDIYEAISFVEGLLNLDLEEGIMAGLMGELAYVYPGTSHVFDPESGF